MSDAPATWEELMRRLAYVFGGSGGEPYATAEQWIIEACEVTWDEPLPKLSRTRRQVAFQNACGVLLALEAQGELAFTLGLRRTVRRAFARYWQGVVLDGPPWRLGPHEERPTYSAWVTSADFE